MGERYEYGYLLAMADLLNEHLHMNRFGVDEHCQVTNGKAVLSTPECLQRNLVATVDEMRSRLAKVEWLLGLWEIGGAVSEDEPDSP